MAKSGRSFFERLTGTVNVDDYEEELDGGAEDEHKLALQHGHESPQNIEIGGEPHGGQDWIEEENDEKQLTVDVFNTSDELVIKAIVAGVKPEDLDISITRDMVTIRGKREEIREIEKSDYFYRELFWGAFSRTILLPQEIEVEQAQASEKHGLLTIHLPKIDKERQTKLKVKSG